MSDCIEPSSESASRDGKLRHVKCLNFGQSILELDVADQLGYTARSKHALVIERSVAHIPCTMKKDYVRKWIETHKDGGSDLSDDFSQLSPVLGTWKAETCESSPVLGDSEKQFRKRNHVSRHAVLRSVDDNSDGQEQNARSAHFTIQQLEENGASKEENQNKQEHLHKIQFTPPSAELIADGSPVLNTRLYSYKRRRRKLLFETEDGTEDHVSPKRLKLYNENTHRELDSSFDIVCEKTIDHNELEEDSSVKETTFHIETEESPERLQMCTTRIALSHTPQRLCSGSSSSHNNNKVDPKIEVDTSDKSNEGEYNKLSSTSSSTNNSLSNVIEEVNTQDMLPIMRTTQFSAKSLFTSRSQSKASQLLGKQFSNETYCSEAEMLQNQSTHLSAKISLMTSLTREITESKSTQTPVISTISTPSKVSPDETMYARLLDSGKKTHKAKKGSMVAKLQSLINTQISDIRIWRHRMKKKHEIASARFISVLVRDCTKRFGNQFLKGTLLEDRFSLLQSDTETGEAESRDVQTPATRTSCRDLTIVLVCDLVGTLKMMSQVVINVHPPWDILDKIDLTLEAMYVSISHEMPDSHTDQDNSRKREKLILKEFNCPCIEEKRELPFCARKPSADKPDVMQRIFYF